MPQQYGLLLLLDILNSLGDGCLGKCCVGNVFLCVVAATFTAAKAKQR
jgi:hypothetical protein